MNPLNRAETFTRLILRTIFAMLMLTGFCFAGCEAEPFWLNVVICTAGVCIMAGFGFLFITTFRR